MSIEEIIAVVERLADGAEACAIAPGEPEAERKKHERSVQALREAVALLKTNPDAQPNEPLTLEELREMDGKPVWIVGVSSINNFKGNWDICEWVDEKSIIYPHCMESPDLEIYGGTWKAYRRPPKEGQ